MWLGFLIVTNTDFLPLSIINMAVSLSGLTSTLPLPPLRHGPFPARSPSSAQLSVLCINCQETIPLSFVETHSRTCTRLSDEVVSAETSSDPLTSLYLRISKLKKYLGDIREEGELQAGEKNYISIAIRHLQQLTDMPTVTGTQEVLRALSSLLVTFTGSDAMLVLLERVKSIAIEQEKTLKYVEIDMKRAEIRNLRSQLESEKMKFAIWQESVSKLNLTPRPHIETVHSQVISRNSLSECSTPVTLDEDIPIYEEPCVYEVSTDPEEQKRMFLAKALELKLGMRRTDQQQFIPLQDLYTRAIQQNIAFSDWTNYIQMQLNDKTNWSYRDKTYKRFATKPVQSKFTYFKTIKEEEIESQNSFSPNK